MCVCVYVRLHTRGLCSIVHGGFVSTGSHVHKKASEVSSAKSVRRLQVTSVCLRRLNRWRTG